ncbi:MAG: Eco57I restriction-modification methylase domain-containing protein [Ignavibacteria bacterium]|jgi:predicted RNA methylase
MSISRSEFKSLIRSFNYKELFIKLGWDNVKYDNVIKVDDNNYNLTGIVEKRGFIVIACTSANGFPDANVRKKIDKQITRHFYEHLLIFHDNSSKQIWQIARKEPNKPIQVREITYHNHQEPEQLYQKLKGLLFTLDEEEKIGLADVKLRVTEQFSQNAEKVTKKFYAEFKTQHTAFQSFIEGIKDKANKDWYTSLMLNRLMFIYFIQKKGFLDNNANYLSDKLKESINRKGKNKFYKSFYRNFLLVLFHKGLGNPEHDGKLLKEIGKVPYLNGGLFDEHELEKNNKELDIKDKAFERLFNFFDEYNWHLDTNITASGRDINPDVIGYIFEKYINDRASMGAYYTKEDITEYISKNTIIPFLFDKVKKDCANAFKDESSLWLMLEENPGKYIYDAVKHGIYKVSPLPEGGDTEGVRPLPPEIEIGIDTTKPNLLERRKDWNKPAPKEYALPTEIWREVVERRQRYFEIRNKIENNEIKEINDFITYNLNIRQFAQDAVEQYEGSDFINAFYKAIKEITILDPTCGSGAFLFAALNILEPLYETCIKRMREFVEQADENNKKQKHPVFRKVLADIEKHPNEKYYIYKSIILNNLYGVDIMKEAVEIAKLRLFLKLVAEVEPDGKKENYGLEPLPDIDFNIRPGNTLVGYTTYKQIESAFEETEATGKFMFGEEKQFLKKIEDEANIVADLYKEFKEKQNLIETDFNALKQTKAEVRKRLRNLNDILNKYLAYEYGINADDLVDQARYKKWHDTHQPFHWFAEFYEIVHEKGGFGVIIGNPPYIEYSSIKRIYTIIKMSTVDCGNIYTSIVEAALKLACESKNIGVITPVSALASSERMLAFRELLFKNGGYFSSFAGDTNPGILFEGVKRQLAILIFNNSKKIYLSKYIRWYSYERDQIFNLLKYHITHKDLYKKNFPKCSNETGISIITKIAQKRKLIGFDKSYPSKFYYHRAFIYWLKAFSFKPYFYNERDQSDLSTNQMRILAVDSEDKMKIITSFLNSSLYYYYTLAYSDCRNIRSEDVTMFPFGLDVISKKNSKTLCKLSEILAVDLKTNSIRREINSTRTGNVRYDEFYIKKSKHIIDEIDKVLAKHYGFTEEELDFIINYDIKYRMGKDLNNGE